MTKPLNVLLLAAEAEPFVKVGQIGETTSGLARALHKLTDEIRGGSSLDVRLALPHHAVIKADARPLAIFSLPRAGGDVSVQISETTLNGLTVYLIGGEPIAAVGTVYSSNAALEAEKYAFFCLAALQLPRVLNWPVDIVHAFENQTALAAYSILLARWKGEGTLRSVLSIDSLASLGPDATKALAAYDLPIAHTDLPDFAQSRSLALGLFSADRIIAPSATFAQEILTPKFGEGLDAFLHRHKDALRGILGGIDTDSFDPANDTSIPFQFTAENPSIREKNKTALQEKLKLPLEPRVPLLAVVTRIEKQKGIDLALKTLAALTDLPWQLILLGTGDLKLEDEARKLQAALPERVRFEARLDSALARHIYAGADLLLMPSLSEPWGPNQMLAMRYGCLPLVRAVGGLNDSVTDATGFRFKAATEKSLRAALLKALALYSDRARWLAHQQAAMREDFSWSAAAARYYGMYQQLVGP